MGDDGVYPAGQRNRVVEVGGHLAAFRQRAGNDRRRRRRERVLEYPEGDVVYIRQEEVACAQERVRRIFVVAERNGVPNGPKRQRRTARVEHVLQHRVLQILSSDGTSAHHSESSCSNKKQQMRYCTDSG